MALPEALHWLQVHHWFEEWFLYIFKDGQSIANKTSHVFPSHWLVILGDIYWVLLFGFSLTSESQSKMNPKVWDLLLAVSVCYVKGVLKGLKTIY